MSRGPWTDENGLPTVAGAEAMFDALDRVRERQEARALELRAQRATTAEQTRQIRLRRAVEALEACGLFASCLVDGAALRFATARATVAGLRASLADGSDEPRYAACGAALEALGALWCCS